MRTALLTIICLIIAAPYVFARPATTAVGPFTVETRLSEQGDRLAVDGRVSGGIDCQRLLINIQMADAKGGQTAATDASFDRYKDLQTKRLSSTVAIQRTAGQQWYISDITIQCINNGVATRYTANP